MTELRLGFGGEFRSFLRMLGSYLSAYLQDYKPGDTNTEVCEVLINKHGVERPVSVNLRPFLIVCVSSYLYTMDVRKSEINLYSVSFLSHFGGYVAVDSCWRHPQQM
jgi:hypothetical protein